MLYIICFTSNLSISNHHSYLPLSFVHKAHREPYHDAPFGITHPNAYNSIALIATDPHTYNSITLITTFDQPKSTANNRSSDGKL